MRTDTAPGAASLERMTSRGCPATTFQEGAFRGSRQRSRGTWSGNLCSPEPESLLMATILSFWLFYFLTKNKSEGGVMDVLTVSV